MNLPFKAALILLLALALVLGIAGAVLNSVVKAGVETYGPKITGTTVTLAAADISVLSGEGRLHGLIVGNPPGFNTDRVLALGTVRVRVDLPSVWSDTVIIEEIVLEKPEITFEGSLGGSNISQIRRNVDAFSAAQAKPTPAGQDLPASERKVKIKYFRVHDGTIKLSATALQGQGVTVPLPDIQLKNLGEQSGGATMREVSARVFAALHVGIVSAVSRGGEFLKKGLAQVEEGVKGAGKALEGLKGILSK
ncbi:MAG: hypothetical protein ACREI3_03680 [Nitrospirales bacterium]